MNDVIFGVSDFVALVNQTFEYAYPNVTIVGELANFKVSKNKWIYFDLKDELASVRFFGTVYALPGPLEDGMLLEVRGNPRLHPQFGFSVNVQSMRPVGKGSIKKAASLLEVKLRAEGLFDEARKRPLPYPPQTIGLITSKESAAYADFIKILNQRWRGIEVRFIDVQVQGEAAVEQIISAIEQFNQAASQPEILVLIRGGGSVDDLQVFSTEQVTRAVAASRIPTMVAIGHEVDVSLAELTADRQASTPSNAAELLVPDRRDMLERLDRERTRLSAFVADMLAGEHQALAVRREQLIQLIEHALQTVKGQHAGHKQLLAALSPEMALRRGYAIVRDAHGRVLRSGKVTRVGAIVEVQLVDASLRATVKEIR
ncbi:MAG TPA: exodeoxyribonuclease VII large subunit [Candidatus Saccharimonadales bacterium]|jgi:exodeoxyribonuclease VII large subunit